MTRIGVFRVIFAIILFFNNAAHAQIGENRIIFDIRQANVPKGYLIGIVHYIPPEFDTFISPAITTTLSQSDGLVTELGIEQFIDNSHAVYKLLNELSNNRKLSEVLPGNQFEKLTNYLTPIIGPNAKDILERSHPWAVSNMLFQTCPVPLSPLSVEAELALIVARQHKPIIALEGVISQIKALPPYESEIWSEFLNTTLRLTNNADCGNDNTLKMRRIVKALTSGDLSSFQETMTNSSYLFGNFSFNSYFITGRNSSMLDSIISLMKFDKKYTYAIGASHLYGPNGVVEALRQRGFIVTAIKP